MTSGAEQPSKTMFESITEYSYDWNEGIRYRSIFATFRADDILLKRITRWQENDTNRTLDFTQEIWNKDFIRIESRHRKELELSQLVRLFRVDFENTFDLVHYREHQAEEDKPSRMLDTQTSCTCVLGQQDLGLDLGCWELKFVSDRRDRSTDIWGISLLYELYQMSLRVHRDIHYTMVLVSAGKIENQA